MPMTVNPSEAVCPAWTVSVESAGTMWTAESTPLETVESPAKPPSFDCPDSGLPEPELPEKLTPLVVPLAAPLEAPAALPLAPVVNSECLASELPHPLSHAVEVATATASDKTRFERIGKLTVTVLLL